MNSFGGKTGFQRNFFIFTNEDAGFEAGQKPSGHVKTEVRDGRGKLQVAVHNLRPGNGRFDYILYLIKADGDSAESVKAGMMPLKTNRAEMEWVFDPRNVGRSGFPIEDFNVIAVLAEYKDRQGGSILCPLAAYRSDHVDWRGSLKAALQNKSTVSAQKPKPVLSPPPVPSPPPDPAGKEAVPKMIEEGAAEENIFENEADSPDDSDMLNTAYEPGLNDQAPVAFGKPQMYEQQMTPDVNMPQMPMNANMPQTPMNANMSQTPMKQQYPTYQMPPYMDSAEIPLMQYITGNDLIPEQIPEQNYNPEPTPGQIPEQVYKPEPVPEQIQQISQEQIQQMSTEQVQEQYPTLTEISGKLQQKEEMPEQPPQSQSPAQQDFVYPGDLNNINTKCVYLNGNMCGAFINNGNSAVNPCSSCRIQKPQAQTRQTGGIERLRYELDASFEQSDPFRSRRSDYTWWKVTNPVNLNNILYQNNVRSPLLFNPAVMMAHYKYRHLIIGIFTHRNGQKYVVCGVPGMHLVDRKPFGELSKWVQAEGNRSRYGSFGYWLVYINPDDGKILNLSQEH